MLDRLFKTGDQASRHWAYRVHFLSDDLKLARRVILAWQPALLAFAVLDYLYLEPERFHLLLGARVLFLAVSLAAWRALGLRRLGPGQADAIALAWNLAFAAVMLAIAQAWGARHPDPGTQHVLVLLAIYLFLPAGRRVRLLPALAYSLGVLGLFLLQGDALALSVELPGLALTNLLGGWLSSRLNEGRHEFFVHAERGRRRIRALEHMAARRLEESSARAAQRRQHEPHAALPAARLLALRVHVDHMTRISMLHGIDTVEAVMRRVGLQLALGVREQDLIRRVGRDGYVVLIRDMEPAQAREIGDRLHRLCNCELELDDRQRLAYTVSIGIADSDTRRDSPESLLRRADAAMRRARQGDGGRVVVAAA